MAGAWAVVGVVLCLATHAHGQLGEGVDVDVSEESHNNREGVGGRVEGDSIQHHTEDGKEIDTHDDKVDKVNGDSGGGSKVMPVRWKTVTDTYQGCYKEDNNFNDTGGVTFINLTQVMVLHNLSSVEAGCLHMCHVTEPFTHFISVSVATNTLGSADSCGCHLKEHLIEENKVSDDSGCDEEPELYRIYCGPYNQECYNHGITSVISASLLITSLLITLLTSHYSQLDVR